MTNPYRVEALALHQVGVFDDVAIDFKPIAVADKAEIHLFTGPNGCGKSTLLYALAEIFDTFHNNHNSLISRRYRGTESRVDFLFNGQAGQYGVNHTDSNNSNHYGAFFIPYNDSTKGYFFGCEFANTGLRQYKQMTEDFQLHNPHSLSQARFKHVAFAYSGQRTS
jgi:predicted ATPase